MALYTKIRPLGPFAAVIGSFGVGIRLDFFRAPP